MQFQSDQITNIYSIYKQTRNRKIERDIVLIWGLTHRISFRSPIYYLRVFQKSSHKAREFFKIVAQIFPFNGKKKNYYSVPRGQYIPMSKMAASPLSLTENRFRYVVHVATDPSPPNSRQKTQSEI